MTKLHRQFFVVLRGAVFFAAVAPLVVAAMPILGWAMVACAGSAGGMARLPFESPSQFFRYLRVMYIVVAPTAAVVGAMFGWVLRLETTENRRRGRWAVVLSSVFVAPLLAYLEARNDEVILPLGLLAVFAVLGPIVFGITAKMHTVTFK